MSIAVQPDARLEPGYYEPSRVPVEIARYGTDPHTLRVGAPGKVGLLDLAFELRPDGDGMRTDLVRHYQKTPLQIMKPIYYNPQRPDMAYLYLMTTGGGILHNDRQRMDLRFGPGTAAHVTTQAHTKAYRMESGYATAVCNIEVGEGAYVEYLPDPVIPFVDSRLYQRTGVAMQPGASLVTGETLYAGRLSRGERNVYAAYASDFEVTGPDGKPVATDRVRLVPAQGRLDALLGGRDVVASLYVVSDTVRSSRIADVLRDATADAVASDPSAVFGVSVLPYDRGAWLRLLSDDTVAVERATSAAAMAAHELLLGTTAPLIRKT
ncbi:urease accessory protein UreD [Microbacterium sp. ASV49]|uniref:Urease accessory protein UreD n=1 Tax=Microbacterium candidum TaxID=3041922 RepID=A0ABT7MTE4_9MICO|nr:urease accessory protein UreD [Microbacterium sp. ASV49]MDL9977722.1 urease accessory protein UreD [Microbacterium sp. ASV49]